MRRRIAAEGREATRVLRVRVGPVCEQNPDRPGAIHTRGYHERRHPSIVSTFNLGPCLQQLLRDVGVTRSRGGHQHREAVFETGVGVRPALRQLSDAAEITRPRCVQQFMVVGLALRHSLSHLLRLVHAAAPSLRHRARQRCRCSSRCSLKWKSTRSLRLSTVAVEVSQPSSGFDVCLAHSRTLSFHLLCGPPSKLL